MAVSDWPKWPDMTWLRLLAGPGDQVVLPLAPTMKRIIYAGERYDRMPASRSSDDAGTYGGAYLWEGWLPAKLATTKETA